jgi:hypothetical protein
LLRIAGAIENGTASFAFSRASSKGTIVTTPPKPIRLYRHTLSGHAHRVERFLSLLGLPYELIEVNMVRAAHKAPDFVAKNNPFGQVPVRDLSSHSRPPRISSSWVSILRIRSSFRIPFHNKDGRNDHTYRQRTHE